MVSILKGLSSAEDREEEIEMNSKKTSEMALEVFYQLTYTPVFRVCCSDSDFSDRIVNKEVAINKAKTKKMDCLKEVKWNHEESPRQPYH